jgi:protoporphyrin/coproporphyrin ferrochelatase
MVRRLQIPDGKWAEAYQSRLGRDPWLLPSTASRLEALPKEGVKKLLIVCPAFVSDCLETLEEIAEEGKESFLHAGGTAFTMIPCMNVQEQWVETIAGWMRAWSAGDRSMQLDESFVSPTVTKAPSRV